MPKRILIVEDEEDNLVLLSHILEILMDEKDLQIARDGHEAIQKAYDTQPDVVLLDLSIPKLDGWQVARSFKRDEQFRHTFVLALTAHAMVGDRERALEAGCDDYFSKPIDIDAFIDFIKPYLA